ncbi:MAG: sugar transferase [Firmicutes bacterium]|nr:sugar transferase [Blautia sp.]MDD7371491.1 sugar transferase [Bacillota bacterium]
MERRRRDELRRLVRGGLCTLLLVLFSFMFGYVWDRYYSQGLWKEPFYAKGNVVMVIIYLIVAFLFFSVLGGLKIGTLRRTNVMLSQMVGILCLHVVMYGQMILLYRGLPPVMPLMLLTVSEVILIYAFSYIFDFILNVLFPPRELLVIYGEYPFQPICNKIESRKDKFLIGGSMNVSAGWEALQKEIDKFKDGGVVISDVHSEMRNRILKYCYAKEIRVYITPKVSDILLRNAESLHMFDTPLMLVRGSGLTIGQKFFKRLTDIVISLIMIVIASPFMLVAAILIKSYDHGPVLFKQKRLTEGRKEFYVYKFRSMIVDAEKDGVARLASANDSRITPVGKFIRATRMDELPQLFNILKGDMSIVGPRPERPEIAEEYEKEIPEFAYRLKVKAGLTGYAQIYGKYNTTAYDKLKLDLMYIEGYHILIDFKLILTTIKIIFMKESTEGVEEGQVTAGSSEQKKK